MRAALALTRPAGRQCAAAAGAGQRCALERNVRDTGSTWLEAAEREAMVRMPTLVAEHGRTDEQRRPRHAPVAQALAAGGGSAAVAAAGADHGTLPTGSMEAAAGAARAVCRRSRRGALRDPRRACPGVVTDRGQLGRRTSAGISRQPRGRPRGAARARAQSTSPSGPPHRAQRLHRTSNRCERSCFAATVQASTRIEI